MLITEEQAMPVYSKHLDAILSWSGLAEAQRLSVKEILSTLKTESEGHIRQLTSLREYVEGSGKNVF